MEVKVEFLRFEVMLQHLPSNCFEYKMFFPKLEPCSGSEKKNVEIKMEFFRFEVMLQHIPSNYLDYKMIFLKFKLCSGSEKKNVKIN